MTEPFKFKSALFPQTDLSIPAFAVGIELIVTAVEEVFVHPFASVTVTVYVPEAAGVAPAIEGFSDIHR